MQTRNSNSQARLILIGCLAVLLITGVLYVMKRVEAGRLSTELNAVKAEKREREDTLNGKVTDYIRKIEEMTKQLGSVQSKLTSCENGKDSLQSEAETAKNAVEECHTQQQQHMKQQGTLENELTTLREECEGVKDSAKGHLSQVMQLQQAAKDSELELDSCQTLASQCQGQVAGLQAELAQTKAHCDQRQQFQPQPNLSDRRFMNNPGAPVNPGAINRPKFPSDRFQPGVHNNAVVEAHLPPVEQEPNDPDEKGHEPSYPEEDEEEDEKGNPLDDKPDDGNDDDLFDKEVDDEGKVEKQLFDNDFGEANNEANEI